MLSSIFSVGVLQSALELGCIYALVALALFLSYSILNIADLSTDGCFTLGCAVCCQVAVAGHPVLALFAITFQSAHLPPMAWGAVALTVGGSVLFNWTGGRRLTLKALGAVLGTVVLYCGCDLLETHLVRFSLGEGCGPWAVLRASLFALCMLYTVLGAVCWGILMRQGFHGRLLCGPVYGNVLNSLRGVFSVILGLLLSRTGWIRSEVRVPAAMWVRRGVAALLIVLGIALYSIARA